MSKQTTKNELVGESKKLTTRAEDYSQWYLDVIAAADMAEHSPVKGCMVIKPTGYAIWERVQRVLDEMFKEKGVKNAYFPLFIPESYLKREAEHVEGFAPECAVVTHGGGKKLEEPLVIRPTSETIIYEVYSRWIHSYRDLPLLINQWANVVRWEMRTRLFLRTTEFLWQEGHTVHASNDEADGFAKEMLEVYRKFAEEYLALPVLTGVKSDSEKFAGAVRTYCIESLMQDGKALQAGTSHLLGQNFAKAFNVKFLNADGVEEFGHQTSWGVSTRLIGALIMAHSDDAGLVLPPKIAPTQVIIIPIANTIEDRAVILAKVQEFVDVFKKAGVRAEVDRRFHLRPGPKFFEWEKKGVPVRIEIGPKDLAGNCAMVARRDTSEKMKVAQAELADRVERLLEEIQKNLFDRALKFRTEHTQEITDYMQFRKVMEVDPGFVVSPWCGDAKCEAKVKEETKATIRCLPFGMKAKAGQCLVCGEKTDTQAVFAKAY